MKTSWLDYTCIQHPSESFVFFFFYFTVYTENIKAEITIKLELL